jgi:hypothetical protein
MDRNPRGGLPRHDQPYPFEGLRPGNVKSVGKKMHRRYTKVDLKFAVVKQVRINRLTDPFFKGGITTPLYEALPLRSFPALRMTKKPFLKKPMRELLLPGLR